MSDVWRELEERLKQKAKSGFEVVENSTVFTHVTGGNICDIAHICYKCTDKDVCPFIIEKQWVRLEDVLSELKKLQENHIIIEKKKFKDEIVSGQLSTNAIINDIHEKIEEIIKNFISFKASFIEELLKDG
ncbi:MAG: hypothetical protein DRP00_06045 [Candidatus Aenigmatarchaeota archaeon]|nr:MAG: hypothetical protein DRP00_06045 [Candidatus Aenigmarchaeota archaeon]